MDINLKDRKYPKCSECDSFLRPDVVLFGETLGSSYQEAINLIQTLNENDALLVIGSSCSVTPSSELPKMCKAPIIECNLEQCLSGSLFVQGKSLETVPELFK
jgi:NAD-dependent SIR2 family protein deacetylase